MCLTYLNSGHPYSFLLKISTQLCTHITRTALLENIELVLHAIMELSVWCTVRKTLIFSHIIWNSFTCFKLCQYICPEVYGPSVGGKPESKALNYSSNGGQTIVRYMSKSIAMRFVANFVVLTDKVYTSYMQ